MKEERNYHIFYRMLAGMTPEEKHNLHLTKAEDYYYLTQGGSTTCEGMDDAEEYLIIKAAMKVWSATLRACNIRNIYTRPNKSRLT